MSSIHQRFTMGSAPVGLPLRQPPGEGSPAPRLVVVSEVRGAEVVEILARAFRWYPVMTYVAGGDPGSDARERVRALVRFFVGARVLSGHPILGLEIDEGLVAAATVTPPDAGPAPAAIETLRQETWSLLGGEARRRYEQLGRVWGTFAFPAPHHHLNMIGVGPEWAGRGLGRRLLEAVRGLAAEHPGSKGVSLTTETPRNVDIYRRAGYDVLSREMIRMPDGTVAMRTWGMFQPV